MTEPLISVIVPTYNRRDWLPLTIESLLKQTYQNWEALIQNDAGVDVADIIEKYHDKRLKYGVNPKNIGLAGSRNNALRRSEGAYLCFLDDDDIFLPMALEFRMYSIKKFNAEIVYTRALQNILEKNGENSYKYVGRQLYWDSPFDRDLILVQNIAPCCCPMFSRKSWMETGYWLDEELTTTEDQDFWTAISRRFDFVELKLIDCECSYRLDKSQMTGSRNFAQNWPRVFKRWRYTAKNLEWVTNAQNSILISVGINPKDYDL
jgi:glycosyltransferase involved in cell wall biosynthesis